MRTILVIAVLTAISTAAAPPDHLRLYPAPPGVELSRDFTVTIDGQPLAVYPAKIAPADPARRWKAMDDKVHSADYFDLAAFASFDMAAPVSIEISSPDPIRSAKILPTSFGLNPTLADGKITFTLPQPRPLTIEINDDPTHSLHLFANPFETDPPKPNDPNVLYFPPGIHEIRDGLKITDNQTLYLAGGAVLRGVGQPGGPLVTLRGHHVSLRGRGIIDGTLCPTHSRNLLSIRNCTDVTVEGVILHDSPTWNIPLRQCDRVSISNLKILGHRANSDGIDVCNSRDVTIDNCFLRTLDDLIVVKSDLGQGPVHHVIAKRCVLWNQVAHALSIGAELREPVDDVLFEDCDVIHDTGREWTLRVFHADAAPITNVRFDHLRIEQSPRLISLWIGKTIWTRDPDRGHIRNVTFSNIRATTAAPPKIELKGFDATHAVEDVRFENVTVNNHPLSRDAIRTNDFVTNIAVNP